MAPKTEISSRLSESGSVFNSDDKSNTLSNLELDLSLPTSRDPIRAHFFPPIVKEKNGSGTNTPVK